LHNLNEASKQKTPTGLQDNMKIVLVNPSQAGNIGAAARAMKNMGFNKMVLVNPVEFHNDNGYEMACKARDVLNNAEVFDSLQEAVADSSFIVGTSRRSGKLRPSWMEFDNGIENIVKALSNNSVHIVFGTERNGLTNEEMHFCQHKITIPAEADFGSLNLSQAILIFCYEVRKAINSFRGIRQKEYLPQFMPAQELEYMYGRLEASIGKIGYNSNEIVKNVTESFRRIFSRSKMEKRDYKMMLSICSKIDDMCKNTHE